MIASRLGERAEDGEDEARDVDEAGDVEDAVEERVGEHGEEEEEDDEAAADDVGEVGGAQAEGLSVALEAPVDAAEAAYTA